MAKEKKTHLLNLRLCKGFGIRGHSRGTSRLLSFIDAKMKGVNSFSEIIKQ
jgi:hypothetical protein